MRINLVWMNLSLIAYRGSRCALLHYKHNQFPARLMLKSASASEMHSLASDPVRLHILGRFELAPIAGADYLSWGCCTSMSTNPANCLMFFTVWV